MVLIKIIIICGFIICHFPLFMPAGVIDGHLLAARRCWLIEIKGQWGGDMSK